MHALTINVGLAILVVMAIAFLLFINMKNVSKGITEHFDQESVESVQSVQSEDIKYKNRLNVMKIFDAVLNRKPTMAEIEDFSETDNEQNMLNNIVNQYSKETVASPTTPATPAKDTVAKDTVAKDTVAKDTVAAPSTPSGPPPPFKTFSIEEVNVMIKKIDDVLTSVTQFKQQLLI